MLELLNRAVLPQLSLHHALRDWQNIAHQLAEPPRQRVRQITRLCELLS